MKYTKEILQYSTELSIGKFVLCLNCNNNYTYYTWTDILRYFEKLEINLSNLSKIEIMNMFRKDYGLNNSNSDLLYFDMTSKYQKVEWD